MDGTSAGQGSNLVRLFLQMIHFVCTDTKYSRLYLHSPKTCIVCKGSLNRSQDVDRHIQSYHLPCCVYCPSSDCDWRGCRTDELRTHFKRHLQPNQESTELGEYLIYDVKMVLGWIKDAESDDCIRTARDLALNLVRQRAKELGKDAWLADPGCRLEQRERRTQAP